MENECCEKCNSKRVAHDSSDLTYFSGEFCGNPSCPCHTPKDLEEDTVNIGGQLFKKIKPDNSKTSAETFKALEDYIKSTKDLEEEITVFPPILKVWRKDKDLYLELEIGNWRQELSISDEMFKYSKLPVPFIFDKKLGKNMSKAFSSHTKTSILSVLEELRRKAVATMTEENHKEEYLALQNAYNVAFNAGRQDVIDLLDQLITKYKKV